MNKLIVQNLKKHKIKVIIILFMIICLIIYTQKLYKYKNNFANIEIPITSIPITTPTATLSIEQSAALEIMYPPGSQKPAEFKKCPTDSDIVKFCLNYKDCCSNMTAYNQCFCSHPVVQKCKSDYDSCIAANSKDTSKCETQNESCCTEYNSVSINYNNFNKPINYKQSNNSLCSVQLIKNLPQKCLELCQTAPNCAAFSTTGDMYCNLYTAVDKGANEVSQNDIQAASKSYIVKPVFNNKVNYYTKK